MGADCLGQTGKSILEAAVVLLVAAADQAGPRQSLVVVQIRDSLVVDNSLLLVDIADMAAVRRVRRSSVGSVPCSAKDEESAAKCIFFSVSRLADRM